MTELEWCKTNAPDALKGLPDDELVSMMHSSYLKFGTEEKSVDVPVSSISDCGYDLTDKQQRLNHLVVIATEALHEKMALKGGYLLSHILGNRGRRTQDVDLDVLDQKVYDYFLPTITELCEFYKEHGLADEYKIRTDLSGDKSGGFAIYKDNKIILKCDICSENLSYGINVVTIEGKELTAFSPERILADKIMALLSEKRYRRAKDIYDVYCITDMYQCDARLINMYMRKRLANTAGVWDEFPYTEETLMKMERAYSKLKLMNISDVAIPKPSWDEVANRFMIFAEKVKSPNEPYIWNNKKGIFV